MSKIVIPAAVALGLIAFAVRPQATSPDALLHAAPMGWHLSHAGSLAKLAYGVESTDQLALMITCRPGEAEATVYGEVQPASARLIRTSVAMAIDPLSGGLADELRIPIRDPALQNLARRGSLAVEADSRQFELSANPAERRVIGDFFAYCGSHHV